MSSGIFTQLMLGAIVYSEKVETMHICPTSVPSLCIRYVPSSWQPARSMAPESQRFCMPLAHGRHRPQPGMNCSTTWSPGATLLTADPTCSTMPAPSCPPANGSFIAGMSPVTRWSSEWQRPAATILMRTSVGPGPSRSTSVTSHFPGWENRTAALVFMGLLRSNGETRSFSLSHPPPRRTPEVGQKCS
jgi:hypothetical protein